MHQAVVVDSFVEQVVGIVLLEEFEELLGYVQRLSNVFDESFVLQFSQIFGQCVLANV